MPRRLWVVGAVVAALAIASFIAVRAWSHTPHRPVAVPSTGLPAPVVLPPTSPLPNFGSVPPPWPTAPGACGDDAQLPIVSSMRPRQPTGIRVLVGGRGLSTVDFDAGSVARTFDTGSRTNVWQILPGSPTYVLTSTCGMPPRERLVRLDAHLHPVAQTALGNRAVLTDGTRLRLASWPENARQHGTLTPLGGGRAVRLPAGFSADAITGGVVVGSFYPGSGAGSLGLVDAATGRVRTRLGAGQTVAAGHGLVVWSSCPPSAAGPCVLYRRAVDATHTTRYRLPRPTGFTSGVLSPDGREVAFTLERARQDPRYEQGHPIPPADVAVLHLDTGALDVVPGVELPAKSAPALAFSAHSRWLVIALDGGTTTRLLAWRPGLRQPFESWPVPGRVAPPVAMAIASG